MTSRRRALNFVSASERYWEESEEANKMTADIRLREVSAELAGPVHLPGLFQGVTEANAGQAGSGCVGAG